MRAFILFFVLFLQFSSADNNLTQKVEETLLEMITPENTKKNEKSIAIIEKAIKKQIEKKSRNELEEEARERKKEEELRLEKKHLEVIRLQKVKELIVRIESLEKEKELIDEELSKDNIWASQYLPYETYQNLNIKEQEYIENIREYKNKGYLSEKDKSELKHFEDELKIIEGKLSQLKEYKHDPFTELLKPIQLEDEPTITNPLDIITALSYQKHMKSLKEENDTKYKSLSAAVFKLRRKSLILQELSLLSKGNSYIEELSGTEHKLEDFERTLKIFKTSVETFAQKVSQVNLNIDEGIEKEIKKSIRTGVIILFLLLFFLFVKFLITKYMSDNELFYGINKVANFVFIFLIFIILLFTYLENVENLMTILSFASAGIAIALKDWFMSLLGWVVILVSGSIHVGDRVKFFKDGVEYVGDIVDISVLRMTLHEDVTLTTVTTNKRSGRIIFIPNNYIFTDMIANYSHSGLKTVWDGIEFMITYDSNVSKAQQIAKEVTRKYSKGYTDMTRKQLNRLRSKYSMRNTAVEPRIFGFIDTYGVKISAWYLTNAYATLTLRSTISMEILARLQEEDDIFLALPSQSLYMDKAAPRPSLAEGEEPTAAHRPE
jgi:small-conductance mechanosensitive channel